MAFTPTAEQAAIFGSAAQSASVMISAYAGCGKTTTLVEFAKLLEGVNLALAFNVKIKKELADRLPPNFETKTLNGLGHSAFGKAIGKRLSIEERKIFDLIKGLGKPYKQVGPLVEAIRALRTAGYVPPKFSAATPLTTDPVTVLAEAFIDEVEPSEAVEILTLAIEKSLSGVIDFDDQVYMSALFPVAFPSYNLVMIDEAQDLSPLNHAMIAKFKRARLIVCGDPKQAIYGFRGALSNSMPALKALRKEWLDFPLTMTYRCPKAIVARQQKHAPGYSAHPSAPEGQVLSLGVLSKEKVLSLPLPVAILCRNNAPLVSAGLNLIRQGQGVTFAAGNLGKQLTKLLDKIVTENGPRAFGQVREWLSTEISIAMEKGQENRIAGLTDRADCLQAVLDQTSPKGDKDQAILYLEKIFDPDFASKIILSTGHRSKGLEWPSVIHLNPWMLPSPYARKQAREGNTIPLDQDMNLRYVIETRAKSVLAMADLKPREEETSE